MISANLLILRLKQEKLRRELDAALENAQALQSAWETQWLAYLDEAELLGFCRGCAARAVMRPRGECHFTHIAYA